MKFTVTGSVGITGGYGGKVEVELDLSVSDIVEAVGTKELLNEIGKSECIDHFDIEEVE